MVKERSSSFDFFAGGLSSSMSIALDWDREVVDVLLSPSSLSTGVLLLRLGIVGDGGQRQQVGGMLYSKKSVRVASHSAGEAEWLATSNRASTLWISLAARGAIEKLHPLSAITGFGLQAFR